MKTTRLTFPEVMNRIVVGLCNRYRYKNNEWWLCNTANFMVKRKTTRGMPLQEYRRRNRECLLNPEFSVELNHDQVF